MLFSTVKHAWKDEIENNWDVKKSNTFDKECNFLKAYTWAIPFLFKLETHESNSNPKNNQRKYLPQVVVEGMERELNEQREDVTNVSDSTKGIWIESLEKTLKTQLDTWQNHKQCEKKE